MTNPAAELESILNGWISLPHGDSTLRRIRAFDTAEGLTTLLRAARLLAEIRAEIDHLAAEGEAVDHLEVPFRAWTAMVFGATVNWDSGLGKGAEVAIYPAAELANLRTLRMVLNQGRRVPDARWANLMRARIDSLEALVDEDDSIPDWLAKHFRTLIEQMRELIDGDATVEEMETLIASVVTATREAEETTTDGHGRWAAFRDEWVKPLSIESLKTLINGVIRLAIGA